MRSSGSFLVGDWLVEPDLDRISRGDEQKTLRPRVMELLVYLARKEGRTARSDELMNDLWANRVVTDATLYNCIAELRHALDAGSETPASIQTIPKKGYRLLLPVSGLDDAGTQHAPGPRGGEARSRNRRAAFLFAGILAMGMAYLLFANIVKEGEPSGDTRPDASIAVLPFVALTSDPEDEYFADGLTEELVNALSRLPDVKVAGRTSSFYYKDRTPNLGEVGKALGVAHVLEGSVRRSGDRLRVTVDLVAVNDGFHLWSDSYDRSKDDILAIQDDIANQVAAALKVTLLGPKAEAFGRHGTTDVEAQTRFLIASGHVRRGWAMWADAPVEMGHLIVARRLLEEAVELDPEFARAWAMLVRTYWLLSGNGLPDGSGELVTNEQASELSGPAAERAVALAPDLPEAWAAMGENLGKTMLFSPAGATAAQRREAEAAFERALELDPENLTALESYAEYRRNLAEYAEALELLDRAVAIDPLSTLRQLRAQAMYRTGRTDEARREYLEVGRLYPDAPVEGGIAEIEFDRGHFHHGLLWLAGIEGALYPPYAWCSLGDTERTMETFSWYQNRGGALAEFARLTEYTFLRDYQKLRAAAAGTEHASLELASLYYLRRWNDAVSKVEELRLRMPASYENLTGTGGAPDRQFYPNTNIGTFAAYHAQALASVGRREDADRVWNWALRLADRQAPTTPRRRQERHQIRLLVFASRGEKEAALSELEAMVDAGWRWLMSPALTEFRIYSAGLGWFEDSPLLDSIRDEPRFAAALEKVEADNAAMLAALDGGLKLEDIMDEETDLHVSR